MRRGGKDLGVLTPGGPEDIRFHSFFGAGVDVVLLAWNMMAEYELLPPDLLFVHYLWTLLFMCLYPKNEAELCALVGGRDPKTVREKTWPFIFTLYELNYYVVSLIHTFCVLSLQSGSSFLPTMCPSLSFFCKILFENRKIGDKHNDCLLSIDGADFLMAMSYVKEYYSYKFKAMGLQYEVGLNIITGDICWWYGPFKPGIYNDLMIFQMGL